MITISLCMIVKNEEKVLKRCLDSLAGIYDEAIIVDTGSTDSTKSIAAKYTDKVYDFEWIDDFAAARNFAMSKAHSDYIYMADADEVLDEINRKRFLDLKKAMLPEIEIVQMMYANQLDNGSVYNFDKEYRAKLYKRERSFVFVDPVHEVVRTEPVVFDSDIEILHMPQKPHSSRDISIFLKEIQRTGALSRRLISMFAKELLMAGSEEEITSALPFFEELYKKPDGLDEEDLKAVYVMLALGYLVNNDVAKLMTYALKDVAGGGTSEGCDILGAFYEKAGDLDEAYMWYYNGAYETQPVLSLKHKTVIPIEGLLRIAEKKGDDSLVDFYKEELAKVTKE